MSQEVTQDCSYKVIFKQDHTPKVNYLNWKRFLSQNMAIEVGCAFIELRSKILGPSCTIHFYTLSSIFTISNLHISIFVNRSSFFLRYRRPEPRFRLVIGSIEEDWLWSILSHWKKHMVVAKHYSTLLYVLQNDEMHFLSVRQFFIIYQSIGRGFESDCMSKANN